MDIKLLKEKVDKEVLALSKEIMHQWVCKDPIDSRKFLLEYLPPFDETMELIYFIGCLHGLMDAEILLTRKPNEFDPLFKDLKDIEFHKKSILDIASRYRKDIM